MKRITIFSTYEIEDIGEDGHNLNGVESYRASTINVRLEDGVTLQNVVDMHNEKVGAIERKLVK
jgi:hypothetical protein